MANANAREWLAWVGLAGTDWGQIQASDLAARCRRRLWNEERNHDPAVEGSEHQVPGHARLIVPDRRPDYLREQTARVLKICEKAGDRLIAWS